MGNPSKSLACRVNLREAFKVIGLEYPNRSDVPQSMPCPLCQVGALTVMLDPVLDAEWFHCHTCKFAGDVIEFAALVRKRAIYQTVEYFEASNLFDMPLSADDLSKYQADHLAYRKRIKEFWETAQRAPSHQNSMDMSGFRLLRKFGLRDQAFRDFWLEYGGKLFGVSKRQTIEDLFAPQIRLAR